MLGIGAIVRCEQKGTRFLTHRTHIKVCEGVHLNCKKHQKVLASAFSVSNIVAGMHGQLKSPNLTLHSPC